MGTKKELEMKILIGLGFKVGFIPHFLFSRFPIKVFRYSFSDAYRYFSIALKVFFSLSDRYKIFSNNGLWSEICENVVLSNIDITMTAINKKL